MYLLDYIMLFFLSSARLLDLGLQNRLILADVDERVHWGEAAQDGKHCRVIGVLTVEDGLSPSVPELEANLFRPDRLPAASDSLAWSRRTAGLHDTAEDGVLAAG